MPDAMANPWLSVEQIAEYLGVRPVTIYKWIESKGIPAHKVGRLWKFKSDEVDDWVKTGSKSYKARKKSDQVKRGR